jgi:hypothetical protein
VQGVGTAARQAKMLGAEVVGVAFLKGQALVTFTVTEQFTGTDDASDGLDLFFTDVVHT